MVLMIVLVFLFSHNSCAVRWFPYAKFFNISETKVESFSKYFCSMKQNEEKCCECKEAYYTSNSCIDYAWNPLLHNDLSEYLNESYFKLKMENEPSESTCQPILNHISDTSGHLVEKIDVVSYSFIDYSNIKDCIDHKKMNSRKEFNFMLVTADTESFMYNKECLAQSQYENRVERYLPIK